VCLASAGQTQMTRRVRNAPPDEMPGEGGDNQASQHARLHAGASASAANACAPALD
jgi:hypothetical protein